MPNVDLCKPIQGGRAEKRERKKAGWAEVKMKADLYKKNLTSSIDITCLRRSKRLIAPGNFEA
jgi:hypothetical protein